MSTTRIQRRTPKAKSARLLPRKRPMQARSSFTVDAILEAAARIIRREKLHRLTTNAVAATAGVSVGSLYQYFPSKEALVQTLVERHYLELCHSFAVDHAAAHADLESEVERLVHATLRVHAQDPALHRELAHATALLDESTATAPARAALQTVLALLERHAAALRVADRELAAVIICQLVEAATHGLIVDRLLDRAPDVIERELTTMILGYLTGATELKQGDPADRTAALRQS